MSVSRQFSSIHNKLKKKSLKTPYPGQPQAGYERLFRDQNIYNIPANNQFASDPKFKHNLAFYLGDHELHRIGDQLSESIQADDDDRQKWIKIISDGVDYLGIGGEKGRSTYSPRNSDIYAPTLLNVAMKVTSKIHATMFPSNGFVEMEIVGVHNEEREDRAYRIKQFMNYATTDLMEEYKSDKKQEIWWMVLCGSVFTKVYDDVMRGRPYAPYIRPEDIIINAAASSMSDAERVSHRFVFSERQMQDKFRMKEWKQVHIEQEDNQQQSIKRKTDAKTGITPTASDTNKYYAFDECMCYLDLPGFEHQGKKGQPTGRPLPYLVIKDRNSNAIVGLFRNWNEQDDRFKPTPYLVQHKYFTGFNPYGFGLIHLALGLAKTETDIQQQLIKAAQLANAPSLLQASGLRMERSQIDIKPGSISPIQTFDNNINNAIMPLPFKEPSAVLMQLREVVSNAIDNISIAREITPENLPANPNTALMLGILSTMHILEDSVMNDLYDSFRKEFKLIYNIFGEWLPETPYPFKVPGGEHVILKKDFQPDISLKPVLDPNVSSQTANLIINDTIKTLADSNPDLYDMKEVHKRILKAMKVDDIEHLMKPDEPEPQPPPFLDPVTENTYVMKGMPIEAYKDQDHKAHNFVHKDFVQKLSADESQDNSALIATTNSHIRMHDMFEYLNNMEAQSNVEIPEDPTAIPQQIQAQIATKFAKAIQKAQKQELEANPPPPDAATVMMKEVEVKAEANQMRAQKDQQQNQVDMMKVQEESKREQMKMELDQRRMAIEEQNLQLETEKLQIQREEMQLKAQQEQAELQSKTQIELAKIQAGQQQSNQEAESKAYDATLRFEKGNTQTNEGGIQGNMSEIEEN